MATPRTKLTVRLRPEQHTRIADDARAAGMTVNDYVVTCALAKHADSENMAQFRALLAEQTRAHVAAIDGGFGELVDAIDERNKQAAEVTGASNAEQLDAFKRGMQEVVGWLKANVVTTAKGGAK